MDESLKNAYTEVNQILELLGEEYKAKIPPKVRSLFIEKQNIHHETNINLNTPIDKIEISRTALIIISILNGKYWETDETKRNELKKIYNQNEEIFQQKINRYQQSDWLNSNSNEAIKEENALIASENISWITKIKEFFRNLRHLIGKRENK